MSDLIRFADEVTQSFSNLSLVSKLLVGGTVGYFLAKSTFIPVVVGMFKLIKPLRERRNKRKYDPGKIYLHMFPRKISPGVGNLSPYALKVETWLRLQKIEYEVVETVQFSKATRQIPYVMYNDEEITDSEFIINYFCQERGITEDWLTSEQQGVSKAFAAMADELLFWTYMLCRYCYKFDLYKKKYLRVTMPQPFKFIFELKFPKMFKYRADMHGIGRKTPTEVEKIGFSNLNAISQYLGDKPYMMGDKITRVDCVIFGHLSQIVYIDFPFSHTPFMKVYTPNLLPYLDRIKDQLWPDWDQIVTPLKE